MTARRSYFVTEAAPLQAPVNTQDANDSSRSNVDAGGYTRFEIHAIRSQGHAQRQYATEYPEDRAEEAGCNTDRKRQ